MHTTLPYVNLNIFGPAHSGGYTRMHVRQKQYSSKPAAFLVLQA